jgi:hypothetical protein
MKKLINILFMHIYDVLLINNIHACYKVLNCKNKMQIQYPYPDYYQIVFLQCINF